MRDACAITLTVVFSIMILCVSYAVIIEAHAEQKQCSCTLEETN